MAPRNHLARGVPIVWGHGGGAVVNGRCLARSDHVRRAAVIRGSWQAESGAGPGHSVTLSLILKACPAHCSTRLPDHEWDAGAATTETVASNGRAGAATRPGRGLEAAPVTWRAEADRLS